MALTEGVGSPERTPGGPLVHAASAGLGDARILVVDDDPADLRALGRLLERAGYSEVVSTSDPREVVTRFLDSPPDLVLLDLHMPHMDGFEVLEVLSPHIGRTTYLPVLILTGDPTPETRRKALAAGARDFVAKPFESVEVLLRIKNLLETRYLHLELRQHNESLEEKVRDRTTHLAAAQLETLRRLAVAAEYRDDITGRHAERVGLLGAHIAARVGMGGERVRLLRWAATLHDVGKIGIPDAILMKEGRLSEEEFGLMQSHTRIGARILSGSRFPLLQMAEEIALSHHEWWNGAGYPNGLAEEEIPLTGRVVAVADVFDSLTHERPYKRASSFDEAVEIIGKEGGRHFDPDVLQAFMQLMDEGLPQNLDRMVQEGDGGIPDPGEPDLVHPLGAPSAS